MGDAGGYWCFIKEEEGTSRGVGWEVKKCFSENLQFFQSPACLKGYASHIMDANEANVTSTHALHTSKQDKQTLIIAGGALSSALSKQRSKGTLLNTPNTQCDSCRMRGCLSV